MAQTLANFDTVLKDIYEGAIVSQIENNTRLLNSFNEMDAPTVDGRRVIFPLHIGRNSAVMSSAEGATLPTAGQQNFTDIHIPLRKTVGRINVTKDAMDASRSNRGAFKRAMTTEMEGLTRDVSDYRNEMLAGYGTGIVAKVGTSGASGTSHANIVLKDPGGFTGTVNANRFIQVGQTYALIRAGAVPSGGALLATGVTETGTFTSASFSSSATVTMTADDLIVRNASSTNTTLTSTDYLQPVMGLFGLVDDGTYVGTIHGVNRVTYPQFKSFVLAGVGALSLDSMQRAFDAAETKGQGNVTEMWCEHGVRRAYLTLLEADRRYINEYLRRPDGGTQAVTGKDITFGGIPFKVDRDMPYGTIVGIDKEVLERYVNVRGEWEDEDGNILLRSANTHDFTALWYMRDNFSVSRPNSCFRMDGITTTQLSIHID